ncbi:MAG: cytochrome c oxidase subunit II [Pseudomonadales bacterium]|nr:cytochrome c oxidase subunit II [Pseudomonadales bacterium]MBO6565390.1 cytochrome c oxidase subunit II [Pseudomonadales bacterium]MBO6596586.1 cytochrome c oxidase subunit II [Pseudomonadales bacterium]MBO6656476.1 cytochrome c oxidase subunit II [Pseudomonadales bacterium]MBO6703281.1 cytochrome c oxidase subunit II [Pseudomonadales bacterium]
MNRVKRMWQLGLSLLLFSNVALADWSALNLRQGVTEISREVYDLHMLIFYICCGIGVVVFGAMIISMLMHRKSLGVKPATFHENTNLEIAWTVVPIVILLGMAVPATSTLRDMYEPGDADIDIEVRGYQWKWQYTYLDDDPAKEIQFMSALMTPQDEIYNEAAKGEHYLLDVDNPLVVPINKRIRFLVTAEDVIHAFWVPDFAVKKDAIPGFVHESWAIVEEPGVYRGQCAELCGKDHGFMPIVVHALEQDDYDAWVAEKQSEAAAIFETVGKTWTQDELLAKGGEVYARNCVACHQVNGQGIPPAFPSLVGQGVTVGDIQENIDVLLYGRAGTAMQAFGQQLNAAEIASVVTYVRNSWGNDTGDTIQPKDIHTQMASQ